MSGSQYTPGQLARLDAMRGALAVVPYAAYLDLHCIEAGDDGASLFELPANERFIGNPVRRAFHGGVICSLLDCAMQCAVMGTAGLESAPVLVSQTTSFLGSAAADQPLRVRTELTKPGKRIVSVHARAFQDDEARISAKASAVFRLRQ